MAIRPASWQRINSSGTEWYSATPEFALYNTDRQYNDDIPYDMNVAVQAADWAILSSIATKWDKA